MAALSIVTVKLVAVGLTRELAGTYNSAYGYLQFFGILADAGLYAVAVRELARAKDEGRVLGTIVLLRLIVTLVVFAAAVGIAWGIPAWRASPLSIAIAIAAFVPVFTLLAGIQRSVFQTHYRMGSVFAAEVTQRVVTAGLIGLTVALGVRASGDPRAAWWFLLVGSIGAFVLFATSSLLARRIVRIRATWDPDAMARLLKLALPFAAAYVCMALYRNMDVTLIALLRPDFETQNALYGFALRGNEMAFLVPTFLLNSTLPIVSKRLGDGEDVSGVVRKTFVAVMLLSLGSGLTAMAWARPIMRLLTTDAYLSTFADAGADTALFLLGPSMILNGFVLFSFYSLLALGDAKRLTWSLAGAAVLSQALNLLLIPERGFVGAALTSIVVHAVIVLFLFRPTLARFRVSERSLEWGRIVAFGLLLSIGLLAARPLLGGDAATGIGLVALGAYAAFLVEILGLRRILAR